MQSGFERIFLKTFSEKVLTIEAFKPLYKFIR